MKKGGQDRGVALCPVVVLRWHRIGKGRRRDTTGRFEAHKRTGKRWALYDRGFYADGATWTQVCETAQRRLSREAQHNK